MLIQTEELSEQYDRSKRVLMSFDATENSIFQSVYAINRVKHMSANDMGLAFDTMIHAISDCQAMIKSSVDVRPEIKAALAETPEVFEHAKQVAEKARIIYNDPTIDTSNKPRFFRDGFFAVAMELQPLIKEMHKADSNMTAIAPVELEQRRWAVAIATLIALIGSASLSVWAMRVLFRGLVLRLNTIQENAQRVAMGRELLPTVPGSDEITELDLAFRNAAGIILESRKKESAILEQSLDVIFSLDKSYHFVTAGSSAARAWGYSPEEILGRSLMTLVPEADAPLAVQSLEQAQRSLKEQQFDSKFKCSDGASKDVRWSVAWDQESKSYHCIAHDISERRQVERKKQELIAIASGELASPLQAVAETIAALSQDHEKELEGTFSKMLQRSEGNLSRLTRLIDDLLDMEQMQSDKIELSLNEVSCRQACTTAIEAVNALAERNKVKVELAESEDVMALADKRRVEQILVNLISNAIKFSPKGKSVVLSVQDQGQFVEISVADEGPGIDPAECELIFERFYQAKSKAAAADVKSTGLGLAICKALTEAHGGKLGVESQVGKGSRFFIAIKHFHPTAEEAK
jgi:PAS domain S-box-containing protein